MRTTDCGSGAYQWSEFVLEALHEKSYWVFDLEATGPNFALDHVTQFGAVAVKESRPVAESAFMQLVNPGKRIPKEIEVLTGITNQRVQPGSAGNRQALDRGEAARPGEGVNRV
jgi:DNA polymerase III alpha subunit (gram-positive type)